MSRITAPVSKLTRTIGSNASIARPGNLLSNASKSAASVSRNPDLGDHHHVESHDSTTRHISTLPSHRPQPVPSRTRTVPLMQTFTTTSRPSARADSSTIDFAVMPSHESLFPTTASPSPTLRVPLLPDAFDVSHAAPDTPDSPIPAPEISVVAADPDSVMAVSPLTEVEGMGADGIELGFVHGLDAGKKKGEQEEGGMIRDLWKGLMEDVFGEDKKAGHA
ncbi:hypothetical protein NKR19_g4484 [Coniochaeta hoffmannii]|uniref:Uncharacterized protein n=1 Tax=Coniochaeta hoffmannii TaxID=91930 RepID=A0AA38VVB5_9PEZI|nr:hypothetical protein NKR19_g4484 [Coniochaeta hoffmannii]